MPNPPLVLTACSKALLGVAPERSPSSRPTTSPCAPRRSLTPCRRCPRPSDWRPAALTSSASNRAHLFDQRRRRVDAWVGGQEPDGVGQEHEVRGADQIRDQRRQTIVVAEADLFVGDGVVFVDDRHDVERRQRLDACRERAGTDRGGRSRVARGVPGRSVAERSAKASRHACIKQWLTDGRDGLQGRASRGRGSTCPLRPTRP